MPFYRKKQLQELIRWTPSFDMAGVSVSDADKANGSPKFGDLIAFNPKNKDDKWLVAKEFADDNYDYVGETLEECAGL